MAERKPKRPRDPIQLAKLVGDVATGQVEEEEPEESAAAKLGRKGGQARAQRLSKDEREEIARLAAQARWRKSD